MKQILLNPVTLEMRLSIAFSSKSQQPLTHLVVSLRMSETRKQILFVRVQRFIGIESSVATLYDFGSRTSRARVRFAVFPCVCYSLFRVSRSHSHCLFSASLALCSPSSLSFSNRLLRISIFLGSNICLLGETKPSLSLSFTTFPFSESHHAFHNNHFAGSLL